MIKIANEGTVQVRIATTGHEGGPDTWTVFPYFPEDPNLDRLGPDDQEMIKSLKVDNFDAVGHTDLDKKAEAITRLLENLKDLHHPWVVVKEIDDSTPELQQLLEKEYGIKDISQEDERHTLRESKE